MQLAYIGLGSNLEQPREQIKRALRSLNELPETKLLTDSGFYKSKPMGPSDQPDYVNAVAELETALDAETLLSHCLSIEQQQGRVRQRHWGERTIDLDVLLYGQEQIDTADLTVPHPGIGQRDFVYLPLLKISPDIVIPGIGALKEIVQSHASDETDYACTFAGNIK
jgi:2-amino-4-hydroxy-6-hydroxymethyldihydropteridine diphosphokinase